MVDQAHGQDMFAGARSPRRSVLDLLSSVPLGISLLSVLFAYCWLGSAGLFFPVWTDGGLAWRHVMVRQWRAFELTEFEWFHTWFFVGLCGLICLNMAVATVRRIPFNAMKAGVWMIHSGVVVLAIGSVIYFATKVEGDTPVLRRQVVATLPDGATVAIPAVVGARAQVGPYAIEVASVQPDYELRTTGFEGVTDFAVQVMVTQPRAGAEVDTTFIRQLLAGHPQFTEDVIPGEGRVVNIERYGGAALLDRPITLLLEPVPQDAFWVKDSWALYVREVGAQTWTQRNIPSGGGWFGRGLPRYNDSFGATDDVWPVEGADSSGTDAIDLSVHRADDALGDVDVRVTGYLRYGEMQSRRVPSADVAGSPLVDVAMAMSDGRVFRYQLAAWEPAERSQLEGRLAFEWLERPADLELLRARLAPGELTFTVLSADGSGPYQEVVAVLNELGEPDGSPFKPIGDTGFTYRLGPAIGGLAVGPGQSASFVAVELQTPEGEVIRRAVCSDPAFTIDRHGVTGGGKPDARIVTLYRPSGREQLVFVAGPGVESTASAPVKLLWRSSGGAVLEQAMRAGDGVEVQPGMTLRLEQYAAHSGVQTRPMIVVPEQRDQDAQANHTFSLIKVQLTPAGGPPIERWLPFQRYVFDDAVYERAGLSRFEPARVDLPDGRSVELAFGRERRALPTAVELEDFVLTSHVGGFTGNVASVRDWTSVLRSAGDDRVVRVSVNAPKQVGGVWLFQSYWDAPRGARGAGDTGSPGFGFTGLGVGTRRGVVVALLGAGLACCGMVYASYVKPIVRRRMRTGGGALS
ncbi:MAG: hypothetical protein KDA20_04585 [Phycisphaerales bacterium]|nr:hypothetical protein [Phycisphaerales bacterium]